MTLPPPLMGLLAAVKRGEAVEFEVVMDLIGRFYHYEPQGFWNGIEDQCVHNPPGTNEGSLKIFSFAHLHQLSESETLELFGKFYREHVCRHPEGVDHQNIRTFMRFGWAGIRFEGPALSPR